MKRLTATLLISVFILLSAIVVPSAQAQCGGSPPANCTIPGITGYITSCGGRSISNCNGVSRCGCSWSGGGDPAPAQQVAQQVTQQQQRAQQQAAPQQSQAPAPSCNLSPNNPCQMTGCVAPGSVGPGGACCRGGTGECNGDTNGICNASGDGIAGTCGTKGVQTDYGQQLAAQRAAEEERERAQRAAQTQAALFQEAALNGGTLDVAAAKRLTQQLQSLSSESRQAVTSVRSDQIQTAQRAMDLQNQIVVMEQRGQDTQQVQQQLQQVQQQLSPIAQSALNLRASEVRGAQTAFTQYLVQNQLNEGCPPEDTKCNRLERDVIGHFGGGTTDDWNSVFDFNIRDVVATAALQNVNTTATTQIEQNRAEEAARQERLREQRLREQQQMLAEEAYSTALSFQSLAATCSQQPANDSEQKVRDCVSSYMESARSALRNYLPEVGSVCQSIQVACAPVNQADLLRTQGQILSTQLEDFARRERDVARADYDRAEQQAITERLESLRNNQRSDFDRAEQAEITENLRERAERDRAAQALASLGEVSQVAITDETLWMCQPRNAPGESGRHTCNVCPPAQANSCFLTTEQVESIVGGELYNDVHLDPQGRLSVVVSDDEIEELDEIYWQELARVPESTQNTAQPSGTSSWVNQFFGEIAETATALKAGRIISEDGQAVVIPDQYLAGLRTGQEVRWTCTEETCVPCSPEWNQSECVYTYDELRESLEGEEIEYTEGNGVDNVPMLVFNADHTQPRTETELRDVRREQLVAELRASQERREEILQAEREARLNYIHEIVGDTRDVEDISQSGYVLEGVYFTGDVPRVESLVETRWDCVGTQCFPCTEYELAVEGICRYTFADIQRAIGEDAAAQIRYDVWSDGVGVIESDRVSRVQTQEEYEENRSMFQAARDRLNDALRPINNFNFFSPAEPQRITVTVYEGPENAPRPDWAEQDMVYHCRNIETGLDCSLCGGNGTGGYMTPTGVGQDCEMAPQGYTAHTGQDLYDNYDIYMASMNESAGEVSAQVMVNYREPEAEVTPGFSFGGMIGNMRNQVVETVRDNWTAIQQNIDAYRRNTSGSGDTPVPQVTNPNAPTTPANTSSGDTPVPQVTNPNPTGSTAPAYEQAFSHAPARNTDDFTITDDRADFHYTVENNAWVCTDNDSIEGVDYCRICNTFNELCTPKDQILGGQIDQVIYDQDTGFVGLTVAGEE